MWFIFGVAAVILAILNIYQSVSINKKEMHRAVEKRCRNFEFGVDKRLDQW